MLSLVDKSELRIWAKSTAPGSNAFETTFLKNFMQTYANPQQIWAGFKGFKNEPQLDWSIANDYGLKIAFPKIQDQILKFFISDTFEENKLGLLEPVMGAEVELKNITGLFIPGLAFDSRGQRLGRGQGFYDKTLKSFLGLKVGLTFKEYFISGAIPSDEWDVPMDFILTDNFLYQPIRPKK